MHSSIDSETRGEYVALKNAQMALKESIATAKASTQRRYRSPIRQKMRAANSRNTRAATAGAFSAQEATRVLGRPQTGETAPTSDGAKNTTSGFRLN